MARSTPAVKDALWICSGGFSPTSRSSVAPVSKAGVVEQLVLEGAFDWVDESQMELLPVSVAVAQEHRSAREEGDRAVKALKGTQALHRALVDNPNYGVCQFDPEGRLLDVNRALVEMLGYESRDQLRQLNLASDLMLDARPDIAVYETELYRFLETLHRAVLQMLAPDVIGPHPSAPPHRGARAPRTGSTARPAWP